MSKRTLIAIALVVMTVSVVGAASYTSATVDRQATIDVSPDDTAIIGLAEGNVNGVSETNGKLDINLAQGNGLNVDASFEFGSTSFGAATDPHAFTITNNDASDKTFQLSYALDGTDPSNSDHVTFEVYDSSGNPVLTASEETAGSGTFTAGDTYYVVIIVDTSGVATGSTAGLSGTLTISAN